MNRGADTLAVLRDLLSAQRNALRSGDYGGLDRIGARLERALSNLGPPIDRDALMLVRQEAGRTADLIRAAQAGLARARSDMGARRDVSLSTYDAYGRRSNVASAPGRTLSRR
ncbi:hypothetical protein KUV65_10505 [Maritalea mobilis]|uniref:hypothetical protein n=1 Tax=Maritalea mobilis TaxID=483324 RepID=UPI001C937BE8|nr:hypothetical protein [Maritalea mobilis]MBY6201795.1 hypothetical protein [Maritalea mobilis]